MRPHLDTELGIDFLFTTNITIGISTISAKAKNQECTNNRELDGLIIQDKLSTFALMSIHHSRNMQPFVRPNPKI